MLTLTEARRRVVDAVEPLEQIEVGLEQALGYVTASDIHAAHSLPRFDNSAMDGYALRAADLAGASGDAPVRLRLVGEIAAGDAGEVEVGERAAARIMTGGPLPTGADAVVPVEDTEETEDHVLVKRAASPGLYVRSAGEDMTPGDVAVAAGTELSAGELALLAALGRSHLTVRRRPRVALLVTGEELVSPGVPPGRGQIWDSNSVALRSLALEAGAEVTVEARVPDSWDVALDAFAGAAPRTDLVISSGGVAVGRYDLVKNIVEKLGHIDFWKVAMQPGKPLVLGSIAETPFLGLPGNPVSVHVGFEQFCLPVIRKMRGCKSLFRPRVTAKLTEAVEKARGRLHLVRVRLSASAAGGWLATPTGPQGSHIQSSLVGCDGVALFAAEAIRLEEGEEVTVEVWRLPQS